MNLLLIYPKFPDTFWSFKYAPKFIRRKAANPPLMPRPRLLSLAVTYGGS